MLRRILQGCLAAALMAVATSGTAFAEPKSVTIFAAASLRNALDDAIAAMRAKIGVEAVGSYAASSALARQIEAGAPADIFISADENWMNDLASKDLIVANTRSDLLGNSLVVIVPATKSITFDIKDGFPLAKALAFTGGRLSVANVASVPAGRYAKAALEKLKIWDDVKEHLAEGENVRAALALVATGEAPLGIVYKTDAAIEPKVKIAGTFPSDSHPPIIYPIAEVKGTPAGDTTAKVMAFLNGKDAALIFTKHGFTALAHAPQKKLEPAE